MDDKFAVMADAGWQRCLDGLVGTYQGVSCPSVQKTETPEALKEPEKPAEKPAEKPKDAVAIDTKTKAEELRLLTKPKE